MDYLDLLQWPAMAVTVAAAYLVASRSAHAGHNCRAASAGHVPASGLTRYFDLVASGTCAACSGAPDIEPAA